jgi:hypothetical protein
MRRIPFTGAVLAACLVAAGSVSALAFTPPATHAAQPPAVTISAAPGHCPSRPLPLPSEAVARAADQARIQAPALARGFGPAVVELSARAAYAGAYGGIVKQLCGKLAFRRAVVVELLFPKMLPSASLSRAWSSCPCPVPATRSGTCTTSSSQGIRPERARPARSTLCAVPLARSERELTVAL